MRKVLPASSMAPFSVLIVWLVYGDEKFLGELPAGFVPGRKWCCC